MKNYESRSYKAAFAVTLVICVSLAVAVAALWRRTRHSNVQPPHQVITSAQTTTDQLNGDNVESGAGSKTQDVQLAPIQLSPQRMQSIGVQIGTAQVKPL